MKTHLLIGISILSIGILTAQEKDGMLVGPHLGLTKKPQKPANEKAIVHRPEFLVAYSWNPTTVAWDFIDSIFFEYNAEGYVLTETMKTTNSYLLRHFYTRDQDNRVVTSFYQIYNQSTSTWENSIQDEYAYNSQGDQTLYINSAYNASTSSWDIQSGMQQEYTYNAQNQLINQTRKDYSSSSMVYENTYHKLNYTYDPLTGMMLSYEQELGAGSSWIPQSRYEYLIDANGVYTDMYRKTWDSGTSSYANNYWSNELQWYSWNGNLGDNKLSYSLNHLWDAGTNTYLVDGNSTIAYDVNGGSVRTDKQYSNGVFINERRYAFLYDVNENFTDQHEEVWNTTTNSWETSSEIINNNTYDVDNYLTQMIKIVFNEDPAILALEPQYRYDYFNYQTFSNQVGLDELKTNTFTIYPNPSSATATIDCSKLKEACTIVITDLTGKQLQTIAVDANAALELNVTDYSKGMYSVQVVSDGKILGTERLIIQ